MATSTSAVVGLKDLYVAVLSKDDDTGATYETPFKIAPAVSAKVSPKVETTTDYGDDGPVETSTSLGEVEVEIETNSLPLEIQAQLLGHKYENGLLTKAAGDTAPYVAFGFRSTKSDGSELFIWLYKGRFEPIENEFKTKGDKVEFQHPKMSGKFVKRSFDDKWQVVGDSSDTNFKLGSTWFKQVIEESTVPKA
ncbi:major tail protein [Marininema halotolerans]|uniref:Phage major tail protein, phi13 family n=1 Tax=Marininema halotolerans TaxID=1155944 RepID=A0A1I6URU1_9BACL|nr:major tail protein [Marininema halotolerans]SFT04083.1 phage major tail protein, phi13 family [Marininema halotolerans]